MVLKWTRTKPEPLKYFEQELNLNPNRYLKRFDTLLRGLLIMAVRNFQRFFDRSFVSTFEPIFILKLD